jgi:hypothetical protein
MSSSIVTVDLDGYNCLKVSSFISVGRMMKLSFESSCSKLEKMNKRIPIKKFSMSIQSGNLNTCRSL